MIWPAHMTQRILLVEDDASLGEQLAERLRGAGFAPTWLRDGRAALDASLEPFALVVLDLMLPGAHGFDVLERLRGESEAPVLVLSARNDTHDKVHALELGADDYVTKPFWPEELVARIRALLRRPALVPAVIELGELTVDLLARRVQVGGRDVELTRVEFDLLAALAIAREASAPSTFTPHACAGSWERAGVAWRRSGAWATAWSGWGIREAACAPGPVVAARGGAAAGELRLGPRRVAAPR